MTGLRIRWRRDPETSRAVALPQPSELTLGRFVWLTAALIVALAFAARIYNVNWDENTHLHPDERGLTMVATNARLPSSPAEYLSQEKSPLNPYNAGSNSYVYGDLPLTLTKVAAVMTGREDYDSVVLVGRWLSALFSAATVALVFLAGRRLFGSTAGLLGAFLMATAPLAIQHAHFFVVDSYVTFFTTAVLYFAVRAQQEGRTADFALAGLMVGLGMACKVTAVVVSPIVGVAAIVYAWPAIRHALGNRATPQEPQGQSGRQFWAELFEAVRQPFGGVVVAMVLALLAFRIAQPYAFEAPKVADPMSWLKLSQKWSDDQKQQSQLLGGTAAFPPTIQWIDRTPYVDPLHDMVVWGMGPGFGIAAWAALAYGAWRLLRRHDLRVLLPLAFVLLYFGFMGRQFTLYMRYFLPLYPVLAVMAGFGLMELIRSAGELARRKRTPDIERAGYATVGLVLLASLLAGVAYLHIYRQPVTRIEASRWLLRNLAPGATVATEHWDEGLPLQLPDEPQKQIKFAELPLYEVDSPQKMTAIIQTLDRADYVVISSNRLQNSIPRNVLSYPVTRHYYEMLTDGRLGFQKLKEFTSYPALFGIAFPDVGEQESWSSYDHPRVQVYKKTAAYTHQRAEQLLLTGPAGVPALPKEAGKHGLMMSQKMRETQVANGTWTSVFSTTGLAKSQPTLLWLLVLEVAALAITPLAMVVFRSLPDRGYLLAKPLGLLALAYPVWVLASLKLVHFDQTSIAATLLLLAIAGAYVANRWRVELGAFVCEHWRLILFCEVLFILAFLFFRELRLYNPDLWHPTRGGEKPMDLAYLTAVARSTVMPPYDPWFAGGYINYYYLGQYLTATMLKLTSIPPEVAYNLAVPTFFALTVAAAFSVSFNLSEASRRLLKRAPDGTRLPRWSPYAAGLLGVLLVAFAGNLDGVAQLTDRLQAVSHTHIESGLPLLAPVVNSLGGVYQVVFHGAHLQAFDFWRSSRMLPPTISITEFPYFSFLFADLHAHMMSFAFAILSIGLGLALANGRIGERGSWREWALVALLAWVAGALRVLNSWDYPPFLLLALAAVAISERRLEGGASAATQRLIAKAVVLVGLSFAFWWPFLRDYHTPVSGLSATPETTPVRQYLAHFAIVAAAVVGWLAYLTVRALRASPYADHRWQRLERKDETWLALSIVFIGGVPLVSVALIIFDRGLIAALVPVLALVVYLTLREARLRRPDGALRLFVLCMMGLALGLSIGVDLVVLHGDIQRMNTVFKFYLHVWILLALASSYGAWHLIFVAWSAAKRPVPRVVATAGSLTLAGFVLAALVYPIGATPVRLDDRFRDLPKTLDGMAYMRDLTYDDQQGKISFEADYQGIQWLRDNVSGTPAIVEAHVPIYRWGSRFSIYTGLPDVLGWDWHQTQQRGGAPVQQRAADVDAFYTSPDVQSAVKFLRAYDVSYVILGQVERLYYPPQGIDKFNSGLNGTIEPVYTNPGLTIYKVKPAP